MEFLLTVLGGIGLVTLLFFYNLFSWGFVAWKFYGWFMVSQFTEVKLPDITMMQFVGITLVVSTIFRSSPTFLKDEFKDKTQEYTFFIIVPWLALLLGYAVHSWWF